MKIIGIPGFLMLPSEFAFLKTTQTWDLFSSDTPNYDFHLPHLAQTLSKTLTPQPYALIGYSFGGRLLLHLLDLLQKHPPLFCMILSSAFAPPENASLRIQQDQAWAKRFTFDPWDKLISDWNDQSVFFDSKKIPRNEKDFNRKNLSQALLQGSVGHQKDFSDTLEKNPIPLVWLAGEKDLKFTQIALSAQKKNPLIQTRILKNCGHRILSDAPDLVFQILDEYSKKYF